MRIWSIHPQYLDRKRLGAAWYEALQCRAIIKGEKTGYKNHPQIKRISESNFPLDYINGYLSIIFMEATIRGYKYNESYLERYNPSIPRMSVTLGQLQYEFAHIQTKIKTNGDLIQYEENLFSMENIGLESNDLFYIIEGGIEPIETVKEPTLLEMKKQFG